MNHGYLQLGFGTFAERVGRALFWLVVLLAVLGVFAIVSAFPYLIDANLEEARQKAGINVAFAMLFILAFTCVGLTTYVLSRKGKQSGSPDTAPLKAKGKAMQYSSRRGDNVTHLEIDAEEFNRLFKLKAKGATVAEWDTALKKFSGPEWSHVRPVLIAWRKQAAERVAVGDTVVF